MTDLVLSLGMVVLAFAFLLHLGAHSRRDHENRETALRIIEELERWNPKEQDP